jgi:hypothetical protein
MEGAEFAAASNGAAAARVVGPGWVSLRPERCIPTYAKARRSTSAATEARRVRHCLKKSRDNFRDESRDESHDEIRSPAAAIQRSIGFAIRLTKLLTLPELLESTMADFCLRTGEEGGL